MNSNSAHRHAPGRRRRRSPRQTARKGPRFQQPRASHAAPALVPAECDTAPVAFTSLELDSRLLEGVRDLGFAETRPIQSAVIRMARAGKDLIACAETGTGKTCAFVVPIIQQLLEKGDGSLFPESSSTSVEPGNPAQTEASASKKGDGSNFSRVLILAPTRELAVQIEDEIHGLAYHTPVTSAAVYGGVEMAAQERALKAGVDIIVATPGRLMDHMRQHNADLSAIEVLVLDEADRMMDMGFWPDVRRIISEIPTRRQTLLFSATMPDEVVRQALEIMREPTYVQVGARNKPAQTISHRAIVLPESGKLQWLIDHLRRPAGPVLVFTRTKIHADRLASKLSSAGIRCAALHADRTQDQRRIAVEGFKGGRFKVLVATDIAARGLDIDAIHTVINYELPDSAETYVHRVGRTGRADEPGQAITLMTPDERTEAAQLEMSVGVRLELETDV